MKEQYRYASKGSGVQCVMTPGTTVMQRLCVDNLALEQRVYKFVEKMIHILYIYIVY